jgi:hypothetical protein
MLNSAPGALVKNSKLVCRFGNSVVNAIKIQILMFLMQKLLFSFSFWRMLTCALKTHDKKNSIFTSLNL